MRSFVPAFTFVACLVWGGAARAQSETPATTTTNAATTTASSSDAPATTAAVVPTTGARPALDIPAPDTTTSPVNRPLMVTSALLLGGTYVASAIDAAISHRDADKNNLYYPIVGPWTDYANRGCDAAHPCSNETGYQVLLILDGIGQGLGTIGIIASLFIPEKATRNWFLIGDGGLHAAPSSVGSGYGLTAGGAF